MFQVCVTCACPTDMILDNRVTRQSDCLELMQISCGLREARTKADDP